jgi:hypothetical protein
MRTLKLVTVLLVSTFLLGQQAPLPNAAPPGSTYTPKFTGDPAHSEAEAAALGYMRTVMMAEKNFARKHGGKYAPSLQALVGHGSFTRRMTSPNRGDYRVGYHAKKDGEGYVLTMTTVQFEADHRAFYVDETGTIRAAEGHPANASSEPVK